MSTFFADLAHDYRHIILLKFLGYLTDTVKKDHPLAKTSYVLQALKILGLEEMLKLSEVLHVKQVPLKKAAGGELIVWDDADQKAPTRKSQEREDAKILAFPKKSINELIPMQEEAGPKDDEGGPSNLLASDIVLWQRELTKQSGETSHKMDAFKGYKKSTEMYVVKTPTLEGKDKIRFASTNGVLVNKKQA